MGKDLRDLLQSTEATSPEGGVVGDGVERVKSPRQSEPQAGVLVEEALRKACFLATLGCLSGRGSSPQLPNTRELGTVRNVLLKD